jgi:hypothetical protein
MKLTSEKTPGAKRIAFHPNSALSICVRIDNDFLIVMWKNGYRRLPLDEVPASWWIPCNDDGRTLPLRIKRTSLTKLMGYMAIDVEFLTSSAPALAANSPFVPTAMGGPGQPSLLSSILRGALILLAESQRKNQNL